MLFLLSPAKSLDYDRPLPRGVRQRATEPLFLDRAAMLIDSLVEWEHRELQTFTAALRGESHVGSDSNPIRPALVARALREATDARATPPAPRMLALRALAACRRLRPMGSRYATEQALIQQWLDAVVLGLRAHPGLGHEIALCGRLIKGYGSTNERGKDHLLHVLQHLANAASLPDPLARARAIAAARMAALQDEAGTQFDAALRAHGAPARALREQPIRWMRKPRVAAR